MGRIILSNFNQSIYINTISGGIVNFGGALKIAPISITSSSTDSGKSNSGLDVTENPGLSLPGLVPVPLPVPLEEGNQDSTGTKDQEFPKSKVEQGK